MRKMPFDKISLAYFHLLSQREGDRGHALFVISLWGDGYVRPTGRSCSHPFQRRAGAETWISYAHRQGAELAASLFQALDQRRREQLARHLLRVLRQSTGYPLLATASEANDLESILSVYSR